MLQKRNEDFLKKKKVQGNIYLRKLSFINFENEEPEKILCDFGVLYHYLAASAKLHQFLWYSRICVVIDNKVYIHNLQDLNLVTTVETCFNPKGKVAGTIYPNVGDIRIRLSVVES